MSQTSGMYGWELLFNSVQSKIDKKDDVLIVLTHWSLTKNAFLCIGVGTDKVFNSSDSGCEVLPEEWNSNAEGSYALRYINNNVLYVLCASRSGKVLVLNLLRCSDYTVSSITFEVDEVVQGLTGPLEKIVPEYRSVLLALKDNLIEPVHQGNHREVQTQTCPASQEQRFVRYTTQSTASQTYFNDDDPFRFPNAFDPMSDRRTNVGLDPLGWAPGNGGMLYNPFGTMTDNRPNAGNLTPGARFDPFSPVVPGSSRTQLPRGPGFDELM